MAEKAKISPLVLYIGFFMVSFLVICTIMYFVLKSRYQEFTAETAVQDTSMVAVDSSKIDSLAASVSDTVKVVVDTSAVVKVDTAKVTTPALTTATSAVPGRLDTTTAESLKSDTTMVAEAGALPAVSDTTSREEQRRRVARLIRIVDSMKPADTADVLSKLDDDFAIQVLLRMKERNAAKVLSMMPPSRAARLTAKIGASMK